MFKTKRPAFDDGRPQESSRSPRQFRAIFNTELGQQGRNVELHRPHRNVQLHGNFLVRAMAHYGMQDFPLPGAQRRRSSHCSPLFEKFLGARHKPIREHFFSWNQNGEMAGLRPTHEALHRKQARQPFDRAIQIPVCRRSKLRHSGRIVTKDVIVRLVCVVFLMILGWLREFTHFLHYLPLPPLPRPALGKASWYDCSWSTALQGCPSSREHCIASWKIENFGQPRSQTACFDDARPTSQRQMGCQSLSQI
jgi:hypothetical protein